MLPGWSSDPYVIVKLCEKKEECAAEFAWPSPLILYAM
jgi:hypothetical protein